ncbi:unnamed protein product [Nezara viridula]|uniref:Uncharacterized protein n=1 Tax=Nezara viridula TaxID=85310 RepID=A0A9P0MNY3_NEZVI|nr:unnamed protein product [Nezara viridula]
MGRQLCRLMTRLAWTDGLPVQSTSQSVCAAWGSRPGYLSMEVEVSIRPPTTATTSRFLQFCSIPTLVRSFREASCAPLTSLVPGRTTPDYKARR